MRRRFAKRRSPIHGYGVFALAPLAAGEFLLPYAGRRITHDEGAELYGDDCGSGHTFLFTANEHWLIDGNVGGNIARWLNHSCEPNCQALVHVDVNGDPRRDRVLIDALRDIAVGEELTFDYCIDLPGDHPPEVLAAWTCRCGAPTCRGTMLKALVDE